MIRNLTRLFRLRLAMLNGVTAVAGYLLFPAAIQTTYILDAFCGVTLLAMGGSAINQLLERDVDSIMTRTMLRPLPQGCLSATSAALAGSCVILAGLVLLAVSGGLLAPLLGAAALLWYLTIYTPLKRRTSLALPLGAFCGAFPPLIGWSLAGGAPTDFRVMTLAGLLFIWQIPHFWLLQERHATDYRRAGVPLFESKSIPFRQDMHFLLWVIAFIAVTMLLPALRIIEPPASLWFAVFTIPLILLSLMRSSILFTYLNLFPLLVTLVLAFRC